MRVSVSLTQQRGEHHEEARPQVDVDGLDVGYLWQGRVGGGHEGGHGEHGGDAQADSRRRRAAVQPERHPGDDHNQARRDVDLRRECENVFGVGTCFNIRALCVNAQSDSPESGSIPSTARTEFHMPTGNSFLWRLNIIV